MMKVVFLVLVFLACCASAESLTVYISPDAVDGNTCESDSPCTLQAAFDSVGNTVTDLTVQIASGTYQGDANINVSVPGNITITFDSDEDDAIFDCTGATTSVAINAQNTTTLSIEVKDISFANCNKGILFNTLVTDQTLTLDDVVFSNVNTGVHFYQGNGLSVSDCIFNITQYGIVTDDVKTASISGTNFYSASSAAMSITATNATSVQISQCDFTSSQYIYLDVAVVNSVDFNGDIENCNFYDVPSGNAISMTGNNWVVQNTDISGLETGSCSDAISFVSSVNSSLLVDHCNIDSCVRGIHYSAPGEFQMNGGSIDAPALCIYLDQASSIRIQDDTDFQGCSTAIQGLNFVALDCLIKDLSCNGTGPIQLNSVGAGTNGSLANIDFTMRTGRAISISGGTWGLTDITVSDPVFVKGNGGAFNFVTSSGIDASFDVDSCDISDSSVEGYGGAIYADAVKLNIKDGHYESNSASYGGAVFLASLRNASFSVNGATFSNNNATNYGGSIEMESSEGTEVITYFDNVDFEDNSAHNGAAIACCQLNTNCNITVGYEESGEIDVSGNVNRIGGDTAADVVCHEQDGIQFVTVASNPDASPPSISDSDDSDWLMWTLIVLAILLVIGLVVAAGVGFFFYRKRKSYEALTD